MKTKILTAVLAAFLMLPLFGTTAYAGGGESEPEGAATESAVQEAEPNPFTPDGTGTVLDNATDGDGKEFFTITTASDNVFYLIIDRQRSADNVYFLNAVTEADLLALAEPGSVSAIPDAEPEDTAPEIGTDEPEDIPTDEQPAEPESKSNTGMRALLLLLVAGGGGAGYYFKVLRPKQKLAEDEGDTYDEYEDEDDDPYADSFDGDGQEAEDDSPPWDDDADESEDEDE